MSTSTKILKYFQTIFNLPLISIKLPIMLLPTADQLFGWDFVRIIKSHLHDI